MSLLARYGNYRDKTLSAASYYIVIPSLSFLCCEQRTYKRNSVVPAHHYPQAAEDLRKTCGMLITFSPSAMSVGRLRVSSVICAHRVAGDLRTTCGRPTFLRSCEHGPSLLDIIGIHISPPDARSPGWRGLSKRMADFTNRTRDASFSDDDSKGFTHGPDL
jgi:hypothetical protein